MNGLLDMMSSKVDTGVMVKTTAQGQANAVRQCRVLSGLTQAQLADAIGVSRQTVVAIEAGDYAPSVYLALRLAAVLATTVEALFAAPEESPS